MTWRYNSEVHWHLKRYLGSLVFLVLLSFSIAIGATVGILFVYNSDLPQVESLEDSRPSVIALVYSDDNQVIGSFAQERRILVKWEDIPPVVRNAIVSVEDQNFYDHWGIDLFGIARASLRNLMNGRIVEGGSTLTQQLSKNLFLTPEKTLGRKIQEAMLAIQIERTYTKEQILEMYCNLGFMGHGQYGFAAAAEFYFDKNLKDLTIEEAALLAALPRSPKNYSPILNKDRAKARRNYAIDRMVAERKITALEGEKAKKTDIVLAPKLRQDELAPYFVEEIRQYLEKTYGTSVVQESGLQIYSTLNVAMQKAANRALRKGLREYDKRHGWRGVTRNVLKEGKKDLAKVSLPDWQFRISPDDIVEGVIVAIGKNNATVKIAEYEAVLKPQDIAWTNAASPEEILKPGDVALFLIRSINPAEHKMEVSLEQKPAVQGALVAIEPATGDVKALVGGYDFQESKFDRARQAMRQTGSVFKPFVYTAAVDRGLKLEDTILDARTNFGGYAPDNYDGEFKGVITVRKALAESRNVPAVKTLASVGIDNLIPYLRRFGVTSKIDRYLPTALGSAEITLMEMTSAYSTFPNDGVRVVPKLIVKVTDYDGNEKDENSELPALRDVIPAQTARTMVDLLQEPVRVGTATRLQELKRPVAGKTGTTNDFSDAWFIGFTPSLAMGVWVGFDERVSLGDKETGGRVALPIWFDAMQEIYKNRKVETFQTPDAPAGPVISGVSRTPAAPAGVASAAPAAPAVKETQQ
ncbi:MAG TPA: PBP1A family penicillin-binding protein [Terriglobia bacterium]|nr:PBP1A family penicillin-binding protein [Terriglobia bacterium]